MKLMWLFVPFYYKVTSSYVNIYFIGSIFPFLQGEWLCLNCQTQRAIAGQIGDVDGKQPSMATPAKAQSQQPAGPKGQASPAKQPTPPPNTTVNAQSTPPKPAPEQPKASPSLTSLSAALTSVSTINLPLFQKLKDTTQAETAKAAEATNKEGKITAVEPKKVLPDLFAHELQQPKLDRKCLSTCSCRPAC